MFEVNLKYQPKYDQIIENDKKYFKDTSLLKITQIVNRKTAQDVSSGNENKNQNT